jgi:predicted HicB family RNase H-like nuclease
VVAHAISKNHYTYRAEWLPDSAEYVGRCLEFPKLSRRAPTAPQAIAGIEQAVDEEVESMQLRGAAVPTSLTGRRYSGSFLVRTSPALHASLAIEAAEQRVSVNQLVVQKLSASTPIPD